MTTLTDRSAHPAWLTAGATVAAYGLVLAALFACLFVVPYLVATLLA